MLRISLPFPFQDIVLPKDTGHCAFSSHDLPLGYWMQCASRVCWLFLLQLCYLCAGGFWCSGFCGSLWCSDGCRYYHGGIEFLLLGLPPLPQNQVLGTSLSVWLSVKIQREKCCVHQTWLRKREGHGDFVQVIYILILHCALMIRMNDSIIRG